MLSEFITQKMACPKCGGDLDYSSSVIKCLSCKLQFDVMDGIPIMFTPEILESQKQESAFWEQYWEKTPMHDIAKIPDEPDIMSAFNHVKPLWDKYGKDCFFEAGCGSGRLLYLMGRTGIPVIGYDNSLAALKFTSRFLKKAGVNKFHLVCGDMRYMPFKSNSIGMIYGGGSIEHFDGQQKAIDSMYNSLLHGGVLTLTYPYISISTFTYRQLFGNIPDLPVIKQLFRFLHETVFRKKFMRFGYEKSFTIGKMERFYKKSGFEIIESGLFDTYLEITFIKNQKIKDFIRKLAKMKAFWPMVYTTGIK